MPDAKHSRQERSADKCKFLAMDNINSKFLDAIELGDLDGIQVLLKMPNLDINTVEENHRNALKLACINYTPRHQKIIKELLIAGIDVNAQDMHGNTALMYALHHESTPLSVIQLLLESGSDIRIRDGLGETALDWARSYKKDFLPYIQSFFDQQALNETIPTEEQAVDTFGF